MSRTPSEVRDGDPVAGEAAGDQCAPVTTTGEAKGFEVWGRRALTVILLLWGLKGLLHPGTFTLMDSVDLAIHETGHLVFGPFGEFIGVAGGTIMQLLMPALFAGYFWRRGDEHASSVALWWVAQNLGNIATYIADARVQELPLVGGGEHDWAYMLGELGLMARDTRIAHFVRLLGILLMTGASLWGFMQAARRGPVTD